MTSIAVHSIGALSIGALIRLSDFEGVVVGVYDRTCNILLDDGSLVTCTSANYFNMPRGIRLGTPENFQFKAYMSGGTAAHFHAGILRFSGTGLKFDLRDAPIWSPEFEPIARLDEKVFGQLWQDTCIENADEFDLRLILNGGPARLASALIGRGPGLTPAGDDILVGLLAAPMMTAPDSAVGCLLAKEINHSPTDTSDASRQMLTDATHGHFIEPIVTMMSALYGAGDIDCAAQALRSVGSSSGAAMMLGLLAGIAQVETINLSPTK